MLRPVTERQREQILQIKEVKNSAYALRVIESVYLQGIMLWNPKTSQYGEVDVKQFKSTVWARAKALKGRSETYEPLRVLAVLCTPVLVLTGHSGLSRRPRSNNRSR